MGRPLVSLCMIVRDEQALLPRCLDSAARFVDDVVVVDTGSTDDTVACAEARGARVVRHPWNDDFAAARNVALAHARGRWILSLDADEWIEAGDPRALRRMLAASRHEAFNVELQDRLDSGGVQRYPLVRLFRNRPEHRFEGLLHEQITPSIARRLNVALLEPTASGLRVGHDGYRHERRQSRDKASRNLQLLRRQVAAQPDRPSLRYFLLRERTPIRGGRAVPGAHLDEAVEHGRALLDGPSLPSLPLARDTLRLCVAALLGLGRADEAEARLERGAVEGIAFELLRADVALARVSRDPDAAVLMLDLLTRRFDGADDSGLPFEDSTLTGALARVRAAELALALGHPERACALADAAIALPGGAGPGWLVRGAVARAAGDGAAALRACVQALREDAHDPWIWAGLGELLLDSGDPAAAIDPLTHAAALAPGWTAVEEALVVALMRDGRRAELATAFSDDHPGVACRSARLLADDPGRLPDAGELDDELARSLRRILVRIAA